MGQHHWPGEGWGPWRGGHRRAAVWRGDGAGVHWVLGGE